MEPRQKPEIAAFIAAIIILGLLERAFIPAEETYLLKNSTTDTLSVAFYRGGTVDRQDTIPPHSTIVLEHLSKGISLRFPRLCLALEDSIRVSGDARRIVYHRDSASKSEIYHIREGWSMQDYCDCSTSFTFEFTEGLFH